jgi:type IV pilus assembly protein PilZ
MGGGIPGGSDSAQDDSRDAPRAPVVLRVEYTRLNSFIADYTKNISRGGTFIHTVKPLPVGSEFIFVFIMPGARRSASRADPGDDSPPPSPGGPTNRRLAMRGKVRWVKSTPDEEAGMGIEFVFADDGERESVRAFVETVMLEALGPVLAERLLRARKGANKGG